MPAKDRSRVPILLMGCALALGAGSGAGVSRADGTTDREMAALGEEAAPLLALPMGEAPGATFVITGEEIERSGAANIFDLLRRVPGVDIRYTPMGGHISIRSTGASPFSEEVLLLIDGSPYNSPDKGGFPGHPNYSGFFPLDRIARIEIVRGPVSVLYGANAFGGVINIVSKKAGDAVTDQVEGTAVGATVLVGTRDTFDRSVHAAMIRGGVEVTLELGSQDGQTPIKLNGDADHSRNVAYFALRRGNLWGSILHQESRHGPFTFDGTTRTARNNVDIVDVHYERMVSAWIVRGSATLNRYRGTTCAVCHNHETAFPDDRAASEVGDEREVDQRIRLAGRADRTLTDHQDLTFGFEASRDSVRRRIVRLDLVDTGAPVDPRVAGGGVYVQHQWHLGDRRLHLITGARYDTLESLGGRTSPRLALVAEPSSSLTVRGSWSRAYRAPTWNERFRFQRFVPDEIGPDLVFALVGNPDLEREKIDAAEAGLSWRPHPDLVVKADLYDDRIDDFIELGPSTFVFGAPSQIRQTYRNRDGAFTVRGGELTLVGRPSPSVSLTAGYAYRHLSLDDEDPAAAYAPHHRATLAAAWTPGPLSIDLAGSYSSGYTVSFPDVFGQRPQPSYALFDAAIRYVLPLGKATKESKGKLELGLIGRNLTNVHPRETFVAPEADTRLRGRMIGLQVRADF